MPAPDTNRTLVDALVKRVAEDRIHGASELARIALNTLQEFISSAPERDLDTLRQDALALAARLQQARPSMSVLHNLLLQWQSQTAALPTDDLLFFIDQASKAAEQLVARSIAATFEAAKHATLLVKNEQTLFSHSYSSTVSELFKQLTAKHTRYIITESAPGREGERLAHELSKAGQGFDFITDAQAGLFMHRANLVFVGADSLLADGAIVNKAGTLLIALAAREFGVPFYVCCESFKQTSRTSANVNLEAMSVAEIRLQDLPGMTRHNIYFDITPAHLVSGWITEHGLRENPDGPGVRSNEGRNGK